VRGVLNERELLAVAGDAAVDYVPTKGKQGAQLLHADQRAKITHV
jgi:hypothetical protein